jgi:phosphoribosylformylglycinamidine (FGAM) synthase-like enzyme
MTTAIDFADLTEPFGALRKLLQARRLAPVNAGSEAVDPAIVTEAIAVPSWFRADGVDEVIILLGELVPTDDPMQGLGGSDYLRLIQGRDATAPAVVRDHEQAQILRCTLRGLSESGLLRSAAPCQHGGLAVAVAEGGLRARTADGSERAVGAQLDFSSCEKARLDVLLFGEAPNRMVVTARPLDAVKVVERARLVGVPAMRLGVMGGDAFLIRTAAGQFTVALSELSRS